MDAAHNRPRLGELLVEEGLLTAEQLAAALAEQQLTGRRLGEIVVERGFLSGPALANALADQHGSIIRTEYGIATGFGRRRSTRVTEPAVEQKEYVIAAPVDGRYVVLLCQGDPPAVGATIRVPDVPDRVFVVASHVERPCLFLQPYMQPQPAPPATFGR